MLFLIKIVKFAAFGSFGRLPLSVLEQEANSITNGRPSAKIHTKIEMADQFKEHSVN